jgi:hypothetical protein
MPAALPRTRAQTAARVIARVGTRIDGLTFSTASTALHETSKT